jgi:phage shock protein A
VSAVDRIEAEAESLALGDRSLAAQLARLETDNRVEAELAQLRQRLNKAKGETPDGQDR